MASFTIGKMVIAIGPKKLRTITDGEFLALINSVLTIPSSPIEGVNIEGIDLLSGASEYTAADPLPAGYKYFLDRVTIANLDADAPVSGPPSISIGSVSTGYVSIVNYSLTEITDADTREIITLFPTEIILDAGDSPKIRVDIAATGPSVLTGILVLSFTKVPLP